MIESVDFFVPSCTIKVIALEDSLLGDTWGDYLGMWKLRLSLKTRGLYYPTRARLSMNGLGPVHFSELDSIRLDTGAELPT